MSDTYTRIYIHIVFAVRNRKALIDFDWEERLYKYITGIVQKKGQKMLAINGMPDHIHFLIGMQPTCHISDLVREVKKSSNAYIKENGLSKYPFSWQEGFGAFSYSKSDLNNVITYILNQKKHHQRKKFRDEYIEMLKEFEVEYKDEYLFEFFDSEFKKNN